MKILAAFLAGFLATLIFHQGLLAILHAAGATPLAPYSTVPTGPLGVPQWVSLAFWGGLWGILMWALLRPLEGSGAFWVASLLFGAIAPSAVALFVVMPLKGQPVAGGWNPKLILGALLLNGAWGLGVALFLRLFARLAVTSASR